MRMFRHLTDKVQQLQDEVQGLRERGVSAELDSLYGRAERASSFAEKTEADLLEVDEAHRNIYKQVEYIAINGIDEQMHENIVQEAVERVLEHLAQKGLDDHVEDKLVQAVLQRVLKRIAHDGLGRSTNDDIAKNVLDRLQSAMNLAKSQS